MINVNIKLPPELHEMLREVAHQQRVSQAEVIRRALQKYLAKK